MGLFEKKKKEARQAGASNDHAAEFDSLVKEMMARDDVQSGTDICKQIYNRAFALMKHPNSETIMRAYDLMSNLAYQFNYVPAMLWLGDFMENVQNNDNSACIWYQRAADLGSGQGARNYADMLMAGRGVQENQQEALKYYKIAMDKNVPEAAFIVGEFLRNMGDAEGAVEAYQKALNMDFAYAKVRLEQMKRV